MRSNDNITEGLSSDFAIATTLQPSQNGDIMRAASFHLQYEESLVGEPEKQSIRQKITGVLVRHARLRAGRSQAELAAALHVSRQRYAEYEQGRRDVLLPELETVAELCGVPLGYFFDDQATVEDEGMDISNQITPRLQRKIVGTLLRQARQQTGRSQKECADLLGISARRMSQYENGEKDIPPSELEALVPHLGVQMSYFTI